MDLVGEAGISLVCEFSGRVNIICLTLYEAGTPQIFFSQLTIFDTFGHSIRTLLLLDIILPSPHPEMAIVLSAS